jgi:hypothetical protein
MIAEKKYIVVNGRDLFVNLIISTDGMLYQLVEDKSVLGALPYVRYYNSSYEARQHIYKENGYNCI